MQPHSDQIAYFYAPPRFTGFVLQRIRDGEVRGVDIDLASIERGFRLMSFPDFAELWLRPAFEQLFSVPEAEGAAAEPEQQKEGA
jgi:hypothetical protein